MQYFWFWYTLLVIFLAIVLNTLSYEDSWWNKRRFDKKVSGIRCTCRQLNVEEIKVENKGRSFTVKVEAEQKPAKISYSSPYSVTDIYINNEIVCKLHKLENLFVKYRTLEYVEGRSREEINYIILKAYKISKKEVKQYSKMKPYNCGFKSFYEE